MKVAAFLLLSCVALVASKAIELVPAVSNITEDVSYIFSMCLIRLRCHDDVVVDLSLKETCV